jgi:hypothetical protein
MRWTVAALYTRSISGVLYTSVTSWRLKRMKGDIHNQVEQSDTQAAGMSGSARPDAESIHCHHQLTLLLACDMVLIGHSGGCC